MTLDRYLEAATRENTRRSYASALRHFEVEWGGHLPATSDRAVSRIKRNTFSELGHLLGHHLFRGQPPQRLTGSAVEQPGDVVEVGLAHLRQVGALRQELA